MAILLVYLALHMASTGSLQRLILTALFLCVCTGVAAQEWKKLPDGKLHIHVLDIGQGDSILLVSPTGKQVLIDGGPDQTLLQRLPDAMSLFDRSLDLVVLTHPDSDHVSGLPEVLRRYDVGAVLWDAIDRKTARAEEFATLLEEKHIQTIEPWQISSLDMGDGLAFDVLWPVINLHGVEVEEANDASVILKAKVGSGSVLLTGDIGFKAEDAILKTGADLRSTVLKVAHHGSRTSSATGFLLATDPAIALISAGRNNQFGHPTPAALNRLRMFTSDIRITTESGTLSLALP